MKIVVYPADSFGCGHFRLIWSSEVLVAQGHDVVLTEPKDRSVEIVLDGDTVVDVKVEADVVVFQRVTHQWIADAVPILRSRGVAVVIDIDDDLNAVHPRNPAWESMHPRNDGKRLVGGGIHRHSWAHLSRACREATLVTVSTPALLDVYARHGRGHVIYNHLPDMYYGVPHEDSDLLGWPASLHSHPDDPGVMGGAVARLVEEGYRFCTVSDPKGVGAAFGLPRDPAGGALDMNHWPAGVAKLGVGIAPLADTRFNKSKSFLKPLEMSALGVPWVASPRAEYVRLHRKGVGALADTPRRWHKELSRLLSSPRLRAERAEAGRAVAETMRVRDNAWRWIEAWERAALLQKESRPVAVP